MDEINKIANFARRSIGRYCFEVCESKCCKSGKILLMSDKELETVAGEKVEEYKNSNIIEKSDLKKGYTLDFTKASCQQLDSKDKCNVHGTDKQPTICKDYPLFITKKFVISADSCPAVKEGMLDPYIKKIESLGLKKF